MARRVPRTVLIPGAIVIGLVLGIGVDVLRVGGFEAWLARRAGVPVYDLPPYVASGRTIDLDGRPVYLDCRGEGSPTVLLEAGFGSGASSWGAVLDEVATFTRVCAWDRPGIGRSAPRGFHTARDATDDLRAALQTAREKGPYVIAAHSLGGVYARIYAATLPLPGGTGPDAEMVVAFVMIDTYEPDLGLADDPAVPADMREVVQRSLDDTGAMLQQGEDLDWAATLAELEAAGVVTLPTTFLSVEPRFRYHDPDPERAATIIDAWYRAVARRYPEGQIEIVPNTGHMIHLERPTLVVERIREAVARARAG